MDPVEIESLHQQTKTMTGCRTDFFFQNLFLLSSRSHEEAFTQELRKFLLNYMYLLFWLPSEMSLPKWPRSISPTFFLMMYSSRDKNFFTFVLQHHVFFYTQKTRLQFVTPVKYISTTQRLYVVLALVMSFCKEGVWRRSENFLFVFLTHKLHTTQDTEFSDILMS